MDALAGLSFAQPWVLWTLVLIVPILLVLRQSERRRRKLANRFISERVRGELLPARALRPALMTLGAAMAIIALAGPRFGATEQVIDDPHASLVVLLDTSLSMAAPDLGTSRLAAARAVIQKVLDRYDGRAGLVVFEGNAEVVAPLTDDTLAISTLLESVGPAELEQAGSNLRLAITAGIALLERSNVTSAAMLLISDGEHRAEDLHDVLEQSRARDIPVVTVMIGTAEGSTVPAADGTPLQVNGETIVTRARQDILAEIARETGGRFVENPFSEGAVDQLVDAVGQKAFERGSTTSVKFPKSRYQIPLVLAFVCFLAGSVANRGAE